MTSNVHNIVLTGFFTGKTVKLNGCKFIDGVYVAEGTEEGIEGLVKYFGRTYQAYLEGSEELRIAQERDEANMESDNGKRDISRSDEQKAGDPLDSDVQSDGQGPSEISANYGEGAVDPETGAEGSVSGGDGYEDAGLSDTETGDNGWVNPDAPKLDTKLQHIVLSLDPDVDSNWTEQGLPTVMAVRQAYGSEDVNRKDINSSAPGWNREKAIEYKAMQE